MDIKVLKTKSINDRDYKPLLTKLCLILSINLLVQYLITGFIAYKENVFFKSDIVNKLPNHSRKSISEYKIYEANIESFNTIILKLDSEINITTKNQELEYLLKLRNIYQNELKQTKPPIIISPFIGNQTVYYCLMASFFLSIHVFIFFYRKWKRINYWKVFFIATLLYIGWVFTGWFRNFLFYDEFRTIFSFVNFDIGKLSFWYQDLRIFVICFLIGMLWQCWIITYSNISDELIQKNISQPSFVDLNDFAYYLNNIFTKWQIASLLILLAFLPWTFAYWGNIINYNDSRYIVQAIVSHFYWFVTWIITTLPLIKTYRQWVLLKKIAINQSLQSRDNENYNTTTSFIRDINPISNLKLTYTGLASVISFLLPFKDLFS